MIIQLATRPHETAASEKKNVIMSTGENGKTAVRSQIHKNKLKHVVYKLRTL